MEYLAAEVLELADLAEILGGFFLFGAPKRGRPPRRPPHPVYVEFLDAHSINLQSAPKRVPAAKKSPPRGC